MLVEAWRALAHGMGWPLTFVSEAHAYGWNFASFDRVLFEPPSPVPRSWPWIHGSIAHRAVILRPMAFYEHTTDSLFERAVFPALGSGLEKHAPPPPMQTIAMAEIDPPLFAGLQLVTKPSARFGHPDPWKLIPIWRGDLAARVWATAHDVARVNQLFAYGVPSALNGPSVVRGRGGIALHDGVVEVFVHGMPSPQLALDMAASAAQLGAELSTLSASLPMRLADWPVSQAWAKVAAERALSFDPQRWIIRGQSEGVDVEARLETGHGGLATSVRAKLAPPLACGAVLRKAFPTERPGLFRKGAGNVVAGDEKFDADFVVEAIDPAGARARLSQSGVTDALRALGSEAKQVLLDDAQLFVTDDGCSGEVRLAQRIDAVRSAAAALRPPRPGNAYR